MKRLKVHLFVCVVGAVLIPLLLAPTVAQAAAWTVVSSPNPGAGNGLFGVASISANDVWAVGNFSNIGSLEQTLTLHWNGKKWSHIKSPNVSSQDSELMAVAAVSPTDVWAVGDSHTTSFQTLTQHWDGHKWSVVSSPNPGAQFNELFGVAAVSTTDVWAVGSFAPQGFSPSQTLIEHWNGTSWSVVASPNVGTQLNGLNGVTAVSTSDIWAVGQFNNGTGQQTLIEHWNGTSWSVVSSPNVSGASNELLAVAAVSTTDVWAVGDSNTSGVEQALIEHWNGTSWSIVPSPSPGGSNDLRGVAIISATDIWAVGAFFNTTSNVTQTLIEQWNGTSWSVVTSPNPSSTTNLLEAAAADKSSGQAWAVGEFSTPTMIDTLTEFNP